MAVRILLTEVARSASDVDVSIIEAGINGWLKHIEQAGGKVITVSFVEAQGVTLAKILYHPER